MDERFIPRDSQTRPPQAGEGLGLLDVIKPQADREPVLLAQADFRSNPFQKKNETKTDDQGPFAPPESPNGKSPWNPKPGDVIPDPNVMEANYRTLTSEQLALRNPTKLVINDFPNSDMIRTSKGEDGRYFLYFHNDQKRRLYIPPNLTTIEIWQNNQKYEMQVRTLKNQYDEWARSGQPDPLKPKDEVVKAGPPKDSRPGGPITYTPRPDTATEVAESKPTNWSLVGDRVAGGLSTLAFTGNTLMRAGEVSHIVAPEAFAAMAAERNALLPLAIARRQEVAGALRGGLTAGDLLLSSRLEAWPRNLLNPTQAAQHERWTGLNRLVTDLESSPTYWGGARFNRGDHAAVTASESSLLAPYARYANARTQYEETMIANMNQARAAHRNAMLGGIGSLAASEVGKHLFDSNFFSDTPASWRTTICDVASPLVLTSSLPWYGKASVMLGTHIVNRVIDNMGSSK